MARVTALATTLDNSAKPKYAKTNVRDMETVWSMAYAHAAEDGKVKIAAKQFAQQSLNLLIAPVMVHVFNTYIQLQEMGRNL
jgi:hypothetical protein